MELPIVDEVAARTGNLDLIRLKESIVETIETKPIDTTRLGDLAAIALRNTTDGHRINLRGYEELYWLAEKTLMSELAGQQR